MCVLSLNVTRLFEGTNKSRDTRVLPAGHFCSPLCGLGTCSKDPPFQEPDPEGAFRVRSEIGVSSQTVSNRLREFSRGSIFKYVLGWLRQSQRKLPNLWCLKLFTFRPHGRLKFLFFRLGCLFFSGGTGGTPPFLPKFEGLC